MYLHSASSDEEIVPPTISSDEGAISYQWKHTPLLSSLSSAAIVQRMWGMPMINTGLLPINSWIKSRRDAGSSTLQPECVFGFGDSIPLGPRCSGLTAAAARKIRPMPEL